MCGDLGLKLLTLGNVFSREGRRVVLAIGRTCVSLCVVVALWLSVSYSLGKIECMHRAFVSVSYTHLTLPTKRIV